MTNSVTVNHSFGDTFNVFDRVTQVQVGQICLMSGGWAAYTSNPSGVIAERRIGTYEDAELALRAIGGTYTVEDMIRAKYKSEPEPESEGDFVPDMYDPS